MSPWSFRATLIPERHAEGIDGSAILPKLAVLQGTNVSEDHGETDMHPTQPIEVVPLGDFLATQYKTVSDIVPGLIPGRGLVGLAGAPKARKTNLALALCAATRTGGRFLGLPTRPTRTLFAGEEGGAADLQSRLRKIIGALPAGDGPNAELGVALRQGIRLDTPEGLDRLNDAIWSFGPGLVILDCLVRMHQLIENDAREMARLMESLEALAERHECTIMFLHHTAKMSEGGSGFAMRGSGVLASSTEANLVLQARGAAGRLHAELREHSGMKLDLRFDGTTLLFTPIRSETNDLTGPPSEARIISILRDSPGLAVAEIAAALSTSDTTLRPMVRSLVASGAVAKSKAPKGRGWTFRIAA